MEQGMKPLQNNAGFMLVTVLIVAAIGLLFGAGALLMFRFQCQLRIERQHEQEKVYAVRSALNYIRNNSGDIPDIGKSFPFHTHSDRDLELLVKPVAPIFPKVDNPHHFNMTKGHFSILPQEKRQYDEINGAWGRDYEYGAMSNGVVMSNVSMSQIASFEYQNRIGLGFRDLSASMTNNVKWWINIGMQGTGGWLQEEFGRRYFFRPLAYVKGNPTQDIIRLCIVRNVTNQLQGAMYDGCRHGWPLSDGERALVFQVSTVTRNTDTNNAVMTFSEYWCSGRKVNIVPKSHIDWFNRPSLCYMGLQIADNKVSLFYINNAGAGKGVLSHSYVFSEPVELSRETYDYFAKAQTIGGVSYGGIVTNNVTHRVEAPELRAVFEVEAASNSRLEGMTIDEGQVDFLSDFMVTPAYQYDVFLEHPRGVTNRATVAQLVGVYDEKKRKANYSVLTYDTHGTEHKGFRQDEREFERKNSKGE